VGTGNLAVYKTFEHLGFVYAQDRGRVFVYAPDGRAVCGARRWGTNGEVPCMARPKRNGRCRTHGGNARVGEDASNYKHGRYFRDLPPDLQRRFEAALADEDLLSTRQDVALLDTRVGEAIKGLQTGEAGELWGRLREAWAELYAVRMSGELELIVTYTIGRRSLVNVTTLNPSPATPLRWYSTALIFSFALMVLTPVCGSVVHSCGGLLRRQRRGRRPAVAPADVALAESAGEAARHAGGACLAVAGGQACGVGRGHGSGLRGGRHSQNTTFSDTNLLHPGVRVPSHMTSALPRLASTPHTLPSRPARFTRVPTARVTLAFIVRPLRYRLTSLHR
jgi:hypothetical protein